MPDSGTNSFDTYIYDHVKANGWRHYPNSLLHYAEAGTVNIYRPELDDVPSVGNVTYLIYLPLRNAPASITVGVTPATAHICGGAEPCEEDPAPLFANPPVVWYGTSIQQGGVASRAGNTYNAIISRALNREIVNLGFANNGVMELAVGAILCDIKEASVIVIDCLPNMNTEQVTNRTAPLVKALRACGHATTPIVLAEGTPTPGDWLNNSVQQVWDNAKNDALHKQYDMLVAEGDKNLHYVEAAQLFKGVLTPGTEGQDVNPTVCGVHSSDLGQYEIASFYAKMLPSLIAKGGP
jgi:hypothetical protein